MKTSAPPPATDLSPHLYYQLVYTLTDLLPPPLDASPDALRTRNHAAIAKVAALLPVNANEADLAAQCIAARAQAEDVMRLIRENANDIHLVMRLNAQYASMVRTSLSVQTRLMRVQATRQKREAIDAAATQDAWTQHVTEQSMLHVADPDIEHQQAAPPSQTPQPAPATPSAPHGHHKKTVSETNPISHDIAFETWMSEQPWNRGPTETGLRKRLRDAIAGSSLARHELPPDSHPSPGTR